MILLPQHPEGWDDRCVAVHLAFLRMWFVDVLLLWPRFSQLVPPGCCPLLSSVWHVCQPSCSLQIISPFSALLCGLPPSCASTQPQFPCLNRALGGAYGSESFALKIQRICGLQNMGLLLCPCVSTSSLRCCVRRPCLWLAHIFKSTSHRRAHLV